MKAALDAHQVVLKSAQDECRAHDDRKDLIMSWCASVGVRTVDELQVIARSGPAQDLGSATEAAAAAAADVRTTTTEWRFNEEGPNPASTAMPKMGELRSRTGWENYK